jgi:hypothetical protein
MVLSVRKTTYFNPSKELRQVTIRSTALSRLMGR